MLMLAILLALQVEAIECQLDAIDAMIMFQEEYRRLVSEDEADIRFVPRGSMRALTHVDQRSKRVTTLVNVSRATMDCPETVRTMARHEACHARLHKQRLSEERDLTPMERMHMEIEAETCEIATRPAETRL